MGISLPSDYTEAKLIEVAHQTLRKGDRCPECLKGKLFHLKPGSGLSHARPNAPLNKREEIIDHLRKRHLYHSSEITEEYHIALSQDIIDQVLH